MWLDWLVFCDYGLCVCPLMPLATPTILLGFLLPWTWGISSGLLQQSTAAAPYLGRGVSPHSHPSWPWTWSSSSWPSCTCAATAPWKWGCLLSIALKTHTMMNTLEEFKNKVGLPLLGSNNLNLSIWQKDKVKLEHTTGRSQCQQV